MQLPPFARATCRWRCLIVLAALAAGLTATLARAQQGREGAARTLDEKILAEALKNSEILANITHLSDTIGARLTGSPALRRANDWAADRMKAYGLVNVRLEGYTIPEGWERGTASGRVLEPDNGRTISLASFGWAPGTNGRVEGEVIALKATKAADLAPYKGKLKGAIVLQGAPTKLQPVTELLKTGNILSVSGSSVDLKPEMSYEEAAAQQLDLNDRLRQEGAVALLRDAGKHFGLLFTTGSWRGGADRPSGSNRLPMLSVAHNHYEMLHRLASRPAPARTRIELEVSNKFVAGPVAVYNTVGEIRGSEKPDEYVVVGAHLDSWDLGQGTTDNGTGTTVVLEAARILSKLGVQPKRTIRFVLFTGEEQGLHGSAAYVEKHKDEMARTSAALVHDTGTGKVIGLGLGAWPAVRPVLEKELTTLKGLGVTDLTSRSGGGSDHGSFVRVGVPGFMMRQEVAEYRFTHHSQADTLDRAWEKDLVQGAQVMAVTALRIANLDQLLPRDKK